MILPSLAKKGPNQVAYDIIVNLLKSNIHIEFKVYYFDEVSDCTLSFPCITQKISFWDNVDLGYFDLVHSHMLKPDLYVCRMKLFNRYKFVSLSTLHQKDYVNLTYDYNSKLKAFLASLLWRVGLSQHDHLIYLSQSMKNYYKYKHLFNNTRSSIVFNGRSFAKKDLRNVSSVSMSSTYFNIVTACLLTQRKGVEQIIFALPAIPNVVFHIIGDGKEKKYLQAIASVLGVDERVVFHGFTENVENILLSSDAFVLPSRAEGFPLALLEAASLNLPCICSRIDVTVEVFSENEVSFFNLDEEDSIRNAINKVMSSPEKYKYNLNQKYRNCLTSEIMANNYFKTYIQLVSN
ncbi:glycosyltransferase family 4 protein [Vibrio sp. 99-8-1]|uniref:glycosyltransferase family 4 protein n=1 Tax=Vibrio sp. 99-8-1 TaxID=2607602 RepID=UPI0014934031|nr:glycosyltransferase family 4 protein [Vibrio sp. 99-8-1]